MEGSEIVLVSGGVHIRSPSQQHEDQLCGVEDTQTCLVQGSATLVVEDVNVFTLIGTAVKVSLKRKRKKEKRIGREMKKRKNVFECHKFMQEFLCVEIRQECTIMRINYATGNSKVFNAHNCVAEKEKKRKLNYLCSSNISILHQLVELWQFRRRITTRRS